MSRSRSFQRSALRATSIGTPWSTSNMPLSAELGVDARLRRHGTPLGETQGTRLRPWPRGGDRDAERARLAVARDDRERV